MAPVLKTGIPERVSGVRIPHSPPALRSFALAQDFGRRLPLALTPSKRLKFESLTLRHVILRSFAALRISAEGSRLRLRLLNASSSNPSLSASIEVLRSRSGFRQKAPACAHAF